MNPFICLIRPAQHRVYSTPSDKKGLIRFSAFVDDDCPTRAGGIETQYVCQTGARGGPKMTQGSLNLNSEARFYFSAHLR